jgi:hypothetical protein
MIDHGAALYFHHRWEGWHERVQSSFPQITDHILLPLAGSIEAADARLRPLLDEASVRAVVAAVPDAWLAPEEPAGLTDAAAVREAYATYLMERLHGPRLWLKQAMEAWKAGPAPLERRATHRVV